MGTYYLRYADFRKDISLPDMTNMMDFCEKVDSKEKAKEKERKEREGKTNG